MRTLLHDLRLALRALARGGSFTATALCTLALGIGATTAVFSVVSAVLLRPLRYADADRLAFVWGDQPASGYDQLPLSLPNANDVRARTRSFDALAVWTAQATDRFDLTGGLEPEKVQYGVASANLFTLLGARALHGRLFVEADDRRGDARGVLVSARLWTRRFGTARDVAGKTLVLDGAPVAIVGVLPPDFDFVRYPDAPDVWLPLGLDPFADRGYARGAAALGVVGRLRAGTTFASAQTELAAIATQLAREEPHFNTGWSLRVVPMREQYARAVRPALRMMLGTVAVLLLIGCFNVANLLLARSTTRAHEVALRAAMGAGRGRIVAQLLTESVALAIGGGAASLLLATWMVRLPAAAALVAPTLFTPVSVGLRDVTLDGRVLAFALAVTLGTGLVVGLLPALRLSRIAPYEALAGAARATGGRRHRRARHGLVVAQIALSLALLIGAGLLLRSYERLSRIDPGFRADNVLVVDLALSGPAARDAARATALLDALMPRVAALPDVIGAGAAETMPLSGPAQSSDFRIIGAPEPAPGAKPEAVYGAVTPGYFTAMGIALVQGRTLLPSDDERAPRVAVINETLARRYWPGEDPIGKRLGISVEALRFDRPDRPPRLDFADAAREVVGVVRDVRHDGLTDGPRAEVFLPYRQHPARAISLVVRTGGDPLGLVAAVRRELRAVAPNQPITRVTTMAARVAETLGAPRARMALLLLFACLAVLLAGVGTYGVVAYGVAQRRRELGVRLALGAPHGELARLVMRQGIALTVAGVALGVVVALAAGRVLRGLLFGVSPTDPATFVIVPCVVGAIALLATWLPARRATRIDPASTLRAE